MAVVVYSKEACPQCVQALVLLENAGENYSVKKLGVDYSREQLLEIAPSARILPQIEVDGNIIGDLSALKRYLEEGLETT